MDEQHERIEQKLAAIEQKLEATYISLEKLRKIFWWTGVIAVAVIVIPLLLLPIFLPLFLNSLQLPAGL